MAVNTYEEISSLINDLRVKLQTADERTMELIKADLLQYAADVKRLAAEAVTIENPSS